MKLTGKSPVDAADNDEIFYKLNWRPGSARPGQHRAIARGDGFEFESHMPIGQGVDPRRFDLMASARDPLKRLLARRYRQTSAVDVVILADLSASMTVTRKICKLDLLAQLTRILARSVFRNGDSFSFYGCSHEPLEAFTCGPSRSGEVGLNLAHRLRDYQVDADDASGLLVAAAQLPTRRSLVFLVSDFYLATPLLADTLDALARHTVIPVMLRDSTETDNLPAFGLMKLVDIETSVERHLFMRPSLRHRYRHDYQQQWQQLQRTCATRGYAMVTVTDKIVADDISQHFVEP